MADDNSVQVIQGDNLELINPAEIDMQIKTAKAYPRIIGQVKQDIIELATSSQEVAESCFYELPARSGSKKIIGPSARLAEIVNHCWTNSMSGTRIIEITQRQVKAQGFFFDLEKNTRTYVEVTRSIVNRDGKRYPDHLINTTCMAAMSIAHRNATFKGIPMAFFMKEEKRINQTALGKMKDLETGKKELLAHFKKEHEATSEEICKYLDVKSVGAISLDDLLSLKRLNTALNEKQASADEIFGRKAAKEQTAASKAAFGNSTKKPEPGKGPIQTTIPNGKQS